MTNFKIFLAGLLVLSGSLGYGASVRSKLELGNGGFDETLTGDGDFFEGHPSEKTDDWNWTLDFEFSELPTSDTSGNPTSEHVYTLNPQSSYEAASGFGVGVKYTYSNTPEENLISYGPELDIFYDVERAPPDRKSGSQESHGNSKFVPHTKFKVGVNDIEFVQTFFGLTSPPNGRVVTSRLFVPRPTTGFNNLRQIGAIAEVEASPSDFLTVTLTYTYYFYDRNVASFLEFINLPLLARSGIGGFASAVTNFSQVTTDLVTTLYPLEDWSVDLEVINSVSAVDLSAGWSYQGTLNRDLGPWTAGLGGGRNQSSLSGDSYYYVIAGAYNF